MTGSNVMWIPTIDGSGGLASTPGPADGHAAAIVFGYSTPGDGGGGQFYWQLDGTPFPYYRTDQGTVFRVGDVGCWIRLYSGPVNVRWFGAKGDGRTDDTDAINRAIETAENHTAPKFFPPDGPHFPAPPPATIYFPAGVYLVTGLALDEMNSGVTLIGEGPLAAYHDPDLQPWGAGSIIRLNTPAESLLKVAACNNFRVQNLWWDANHLATDVVHFKLETHKGHFDNCVFSGPALKTDDSPGGYVHHFTSKEKADRVFAAVSSLSFHRCVLRGDRFDAKQRIAACIYNDVTVPYEVEYHDCDFGGADIIAHFNAGSCDFYGGTMRDWTTAAIRVESSCQSFHVENVDSINDAERMALFFQRVIGEDAVNETGPFFQQVPGAIRNSREPITIRDCEVGSAPIEFIGTQPLTLIDVMIGAPVKVNPDPNWGTYQLTSINTAFVSHNGFTGSGYPDAVNEIGTVPAQPPPHKTQ